jgi:hypothetical protein
MVGFVKPIGGMESTGSALGPKFRRISRAIESPTLRKAGMLATDRYIVCVRSLDVIHVTSEFPSNMCCPTETAVFTYEVL